MDAKEAWFKAVILVKKHKLNDWNVGFIDSTRKFGSCNYTDRSITLSRRYVEINDWNRVKDTILHEIAHALTPGHKHDEVWVKKCLEIGCDGQKYFSKENTIMPKGRFLYQCVACGMELDFNSKLRNVEHKYHSKCGEKGRLKKLFEERNKRARK